MSLVTGLELKKCKLRIKMLRNSFKKSGEKHWYQSLCQNIMFFLHGCEQLHWNYMSDFSEFLRVTGTFLNQADCRTFQTSIFKKHVILNMYLDIILWLDILRANELIKCFGLVIVRYSQICLDQWNSKILETSVTKEKF